MTAEVGQIMLIPNAVQNIAIIISELRAASIDSDAVECDISEIGDGGLVLIWSCKGRHDNDGLWIDMLCRHAPVSLDGKGEIEFAEGGFRYRLSIGEAQRV